MENISKARRAFFALGRLGAFQGDLNPLSSCSIFETCIIPALLYGSETWLLDSSSLKALESFQHEIGCRILRVPKFYSKAAVRIGLHWPTVSSRILIRKLSFLSKLLAGSRDTISHRVFTSLAMEDIFETSIVQQCRMLEANLNTSVLAECLTHPECAPDIVKRSKVNIINSDFKLLLTSEIEKCGSAAPAACIATQTSWRRLWDVALEKGIKGTRIMQMLFKELCRPMSCFKCSKCDPEVLSDSSCLEHICNNHPNEIRNLSYDHLISVLKEADSETIFSSCKFLSNSNSIWTFKHSK